MYLVTGNVYSLTGIAYSVGNENSGVRTEETIKNGRCGIALLASV